jgi:hypothetical protein
MEAGKQRSKETSSREASPVSDAGGTFPSWIALVMCFSMVARDEAKKTCTCEQNKDKD